MGPTFVGPTSAKRGKYVTYRWYRKWDEKKHVAE